MRIERIVLTRTMAALGVAAVCLLSACSGPEVLPPSGKHPALAPVDVKLFQDQPKKYELLGTVEVPVTPEMKWDEKADSTAGFEALKAKAAAQGANGVLLRSDPGTFDNAVGAGYQGKYYLVPMKLKPPTAIAQAIFVIKE